MRFFGCAVLTALLLSSCRTQVVEVERWQRDTVAVERVQEVVQHQRDTFTIVQQAAAEIERQQLDTAGRVRVIERFIYNTIATNSGGTVKTEVVHDTITVQAGSTEKVQQVKKTPARSGTLWPVLATAAAVTLVNACIYFWMRKRKV